MKPLAGTVSWLILAAMLAFHAITNVLFIHADARPCNINELSHVMGAIDFLNLVIDEEDDYSAYLQAFNGYPPAGMVATAAYAILGREHVSARYSQVIFSALLALGLYGIGSALFDRRTGLLAVFLCLTAPAACEVSRQYLLEWPLTATATLATYFLLRSEGFTIRSHSLLAGLFVGLAALCKQTFLIFLAGPLLFSAGLWIKKMRESVQENTGAPEKAVGWPTSLKAALSYAAAFLLSWCIYSEKHRADIDNWMAALFGNLRPWGMIYLILTALILGTALFLFVIRPSPFRNAMMAGLLSVFAASLWYFPKGIPNAITYLVQMRMNVEKSRMSPVSLLHFYVEHVKTYYLGPVLLGIIGASLLLYLLITLGRPYLNRYFLLKEMLPSKRGLAFSMLWLGIPAVSFFFITIQNEMNTVPLLPPLYLLAAAMLVGPRMPYSKKAQRQIDSGSHRLAARSMRSAIAFLSIFLAFAAVLNGLATSMVFRTGSGFSPLPFTVDENLAKKLMPRKFNDLNYLLPRPQAWHVEDIAGEMIRRAQSQKPRILIMDVAFYFSWNTFWYEFKLRHHQAEILTQWYDDRDLLSASSGLDAELYSYESILFREPWREIYADSYNDYLDYKHLWETYAFLSAPPAGFMETYKKAGSWKLPDGSTAFLLSKK